MTERTILIAAEDGSDINNVRLCGYSISEAMVELANTLGALGREVVSEGHEEEMLEEIFGLVRREFNEEDDGEDSAAPAGTVPDDFHTNQ